MPLAWSRQLIFNQKGPTTTPIQNKLLSYIELTQNNDPDKHVLLSLLPDY